ncbi:LysR family transcriptional regulator [uncultured Hoeflea sp.]|uniref:LysR family transcriptional regulator n=1 Tax=uncultured Hoeflea sp. TaxID=538666 RepID=UPI0026116CF2|nr:LysR family transcriptional regulator [uncultured Hoeflea sp.]
MEIIELRALTIVVERGTFTAAAEAMKTDKAHVSRIVSRLEKKLGAQLLQRSTRQLSLTEVGREFYERAAGIILALEETEASVAQSMGRPTGVLKVTAGTEYGSLVVNQWITAYLKLHGDVRIEAEFTNRVTDIIHEGFDVAIRIGALPDSELSVRKLGEVSYGLYASPEYLKLSGPVRTPEDLAHHDLVMFAPRGRPSWKIVKGRQTAEIESAPRYLVNNNQAALEATLRGLGVALLPRFVAGPNIDAGRLLTVLDGWGKIPAPVHAVFPSSRYMAPKVRAFVDLAIQTF